jgi:hypothetical protein
MDCCEFVGLVGELCTCKSFFTFYGWVWVTSALLGGALIDKNAGLPDFSWNILKRKKTYTE